MINVQIDETTLLNLFMNRLKYWITNDDVLALYEDYLEELIDSGCFDGTELNVSRFVDSLYINDTIIMDKKELLENYIDIYDSEKVLAKNEDKDLYLVSNY